MKEAIERIREILKVEGITQESFAMHVGLKPSRLKNLLGGQGNLSLEEANLISEKYQEYSFWLVYGKELPEAGQISPMTKTV